MIRPRFARTRWTSFGAALALVLGAGGVLTSSAATPGTASTFVPITPCRLADTRPGTDNIGTRNTPIGPNDTFTAQVTGTNGNCTIPTTATGVSMNITAIAPTAASFLTVWPTDQTRPLTANLNWTAGQAPTPNAVTATLSTTGAISLYNLSGNVDVTIDIVGYYQPATNGPAGPIGPRGAHQALAQVITVAASGGDHTSVAAAVAAASDASAAKPYVIDIAPGIYTEAGPIALGGWIDLRGAGLTATTIRCTCAGDTLLSPRSAVIDITGSHRPTEIRDLQVDNAAAAADGATAVGIRVTADATATVRSVYVTVNGIVPNAYGFHLEQAEVRIVDSFAAASAATDAYGINTVGANLVVDGGTFQAVAGHLAAGIYGVGGTVSVRNVTGAGLAGGTGQPFAFAFGIGFGGGASASVEASSAIAWGQTSAIAFGADESAAVSLDTVELLAQGSFFPSASNIAVKAAGGASVSVRASTINGASAAVVNDGGTLRVADTTMSGAIVGPTGSTCTNVFTPALAPVTCP